MKKFLALLIGFALFFNTALAVSFAQEFALRNAGFVETSIWYSKESFFDGDTVRVYTIVFNGNTYRLEGVVEFYDNDSLLGSKNFSLGGEGRVRDVWVDFTARSGRHVITARMVKASAVFPDGKKFIVAAGNMSTGKSERIVDFDTDRDGVGNNEDADDDDDNVLDVDEIRNNTNPLKKDTDGNGISDGKEIELAVVRKSLENARLLTQPAQTLGRMEAIMVTASEVIPRPVKQGVASTTNTVERFRVGNGYVFRLAKEEKAKEIEKIKEHERILAKDPQKQLFVPEDTTKKPAAYAMLGILTALQYFFEWKIFFYGTVFYLLYFSVRWVVRRVRNR